MSEVTDMKWRMPIAGDEREYLNRGWSRSNRLLRRIYKELGPKETHEGKFRSVPTKKFAAIGQREAIRKWNGMSDEQVRLMHRIAKHLEDAL